MRSLLTGLLIDLLTMFILSSGLFLYFFLFSILICFQGEFWACSGILLPIRELGDNSVVY